LKTLRSASRLIKCVAVASVGLALLAVRNQAQAQHFSQLQQADTPLVLRAKGSFFVGGNTVEQSYEELGSQRAADRITINQMYVEYMVPNTQLKSPVIMVHGAGLSGKSFDTTPDGRMGWFEYFVRQSHPVYIVDQVGRARSGFDQAVFNKVGASVAAPQIQPKIVRLGDRIAAWVNFRFGTADGKPFPDTKFPIAAAAELSKQGIPDLNQMLPKANPTYAALATLATDLGGAVIIGHSQAGGHPIQAALLHPDKVKAIVMVEPGGCDASSFSSQQIAILARIPTLIMYADNLDGATGLPGPGWQARFDDCHALVKRLNEAKGIAQIISLPKMGIRGNSHLVMMDTNNLQIADLILKWMDTNVR
jgi:pimeloyl-ACP methyl ester carboxylesterase